MGLFDRLRGIGDPVDGVFELVACSMNSGGAVYENCSMDGVVSAAGVTPTSVHHTSLLTPTAKWPQPGQRLPVTFDRADPSRLKIRWDAIPSNAQTARLLAQQQAQQAAASMQAGAAAGAAAGAGASAAAAGTTGSPQADALIADLVARARAAGATVTTNVETSVVGAEGRALPGAVGGGLSEAESAQAVGGGAAALGLSPMTARVLAAHEVQVPAGLPQAPGGTWDLTLDLDPAAGSGWTTVLRISFSSPERRAAIAAVGRTLPVLADPERHDRVAIDTARLS